MIFAKAKQLQAQSVPFIMITLLDIKGSAPQDIGAKCLVTADGLEVGTIGGGKVEAHCIEYAQAILKSNDKKPEIQTWNLQKDIGMTCGGECTFLFEKIEGSPWKIVIFGAGHVAQSLTRALAKINCHVTCIDSRSEWIKKLDQDQDNLKSIQHDHPKELIKTLDAGSYFISMTQGHSYDTPILAEIGKSYPQCPYVGVIGSKSKGNTIKAELAAAGCSADFIEKLRVPIGLPIGTNNPEEISISIIAELLQVRDQTKRS
jgi:xanthine dehydrogenase accessory factor